MMRIKNGKWKVWPARTRTLEKGELTHHVRHIEQFDRPNAGSDHPNFLPYFERHCETPPTKGFVGASKFTP